MTQHLTHSICKVGIHLCRSKQVLLCIMFCILDFRVSDCIISHIESEVGFDYVSNPLHVEGSVRTPNLSLILCVSPPPLLLLLLLLIQLLSLFLLIHLDIHCCQLSL